MSSLPLIMLGGGGHARVCLDPISRQNLRCLGYVAPTPSTDIDTRYNYMGTDEIINNYLQEEILLVNGIGKISGAAVRKEIFEKFKSMGYSFATIIHDSCVIAGGICIQEGAQLMAGAVINTGSTVGANTIINTRAVIEHDCVVGSHSHISPGTVICGGCNIGSHVHIGAGSTLIQKIKVGDESIIGAGSLVLRDVKENSLVFGVPAKEVIT